MDQDRTALRADVLARFGATGGVRDELLAYNENKFDLSRLPSPPVLPPESEPHLAAWQQYADEAQQVGAFAALRERLVQLRFPIRQGISQTEAYRAATRRGVPVDGLAEARGLEPAHAEQIRIEIYQSLAGAVPAVIVGERGDFVALVQALAHRNEPVPVPDSLGALMVAGLVNWDRVRQYRRTWEAGQAGDPSEERWQAHFGEYVVPHKELYQDRVLLVSSGPYSAVPAEALGFDEETWRQRSIAIRLAHEATHYFTSRLLGSMRNRLLDELLADYMGIVAATGRYRAGWFLRFLGLEGYPAYRVGGRLENYRGEPALSDEAFRVLQGLAKAAAENVERFDRARAATPRDMQGQARMLLALARLTVEELASERAGELLQAGFDAAQ